MAIRNIVKFGDPILNKKSRPVEKFDDRLFTLLDDMKDTLYKEKGAGLAAVQVGILRRVVVIDCGDGYLELINPEITDRSPELQHEEEGCLSLPGKFGVTERPKSVMVKRRTVRASGAFIKAPISKRDAFVTKSTTLTEFFTRATS